MNQIKLAFSDMPYGSFRDLPRRIASVNILCDKAFNIAKDWKYDGYQRGFASMVYEYFDKYLFLSYTK